MKQLLLGILILTLISCDANTKDFIGSSWVVTGFTDNGNKIPVTNDVVLNIKSDTEFTLKLDKNNCFGVYTIANGGSIKLSNLGCTEMCCDSDFSTAVTNALYNISKIKFDKNRTSATLSGETIQLTFKKYELVKNRIQMMHEEDKKIMTEEGKSTPNDGATIGMIKPSDATPQNTVNVPKGESITLYKSPCKGTCEEYTMMIYEDGTVYYTGRFNAEIQGKHVVKLPSDETAKLFKQFEEANYNSFSEKYDDERIMDIQNTYLTYKGKKVHIRYKPNAPIALQDLLETVEKSALNVLKELKK